jgi:hypothetical protein
MRTVRDLQVNDDVGIRVSGAMESRNARSALSRVPWLCSSTRRLGVASELGSLLQKRYAPWRLLT